eukprot:5205279-Alexandrium_andersonii.AAC.1
MQRGGRGEGAFAYPLAPPQPRSMVTSTCCHLAAPERPPRLRLICISAGSAGGLPPAQEGGGAHTPRSRGPTKGGSGATTAPAAKPKQGAGTSPQPLASRQAPRK